MRTAIAGLAGAAAFLAVGVLAAPPAAAQAAPAAGQPAAPAAARNVPAPCNQAQQGTGGRLLARCYAMVHTAAGSHLANAAADEPLPTSLGPADIQAAYDLPTTGQGQTVAVVDAYGYPDAESDLATFREQYGLPPCTTENGCFGKVDQRGGTDYPPEDLGWAMESALDMDAVSAACPSCHILLVEGDDNDLANLGQAVETAISLGAKFVSNSYGVAGEHPDELGLDQYYDQPGVVVTASTGDFGNVTSYPATSPNIVAVGGTTLTRDTSTGRGWQETAWAGGGSGCSLYEPRPAYQDGVTTACDNRAIADIAADGNPDTGLAVYDTGYGGWIQVGGTSLSAPLVAAMYALAGTPTEGSYPVTYPYAFAPVGLHDVTEGTNGTCGDLLCTAGPGWDGPTGLGTPNGVEALAARPYGHIVGIVRDAETRDPIEGAQVSTADGHRTTTDAEGRYDLPVPVGEYGATASEYSYHSRTRSGIGVREGEQTELDFTLDPLPSATVSGTVTDGSGHGWPLYAELTIDGYPYGPVFTDPMTGHYRVSLPKGRDYDLTVESRYPGYQQVRDHFALTGETAHHDVSVPVDEVACTAAGYGFAYQGAGSTFDSGQLPDGWTIEDNAGNGQVWRFDDAGGRGNRTGGDGGFAIIDSYYYRADGSYQDTSLVSPVADLTGQDDPTITFDQYFNQGHDNTADVDLSLDGGATWQTVLHQEDRTRPPDPRTIAIPQAANQPDVRVRFHYTSTPEGWYSWWSLDDVIIGQRVCSPTPGGLVVGQVRDRNTGHPVPLATVTVGDDPGVSARTRPTADDAALPDGFYWMYSPLTGAQQLSATASEYAAQTRSVRIAPDGVTRLDFSLAAGRLRVKPGDLRVTVPKGKTKHRKVTITNTGTAPATVTLRTGEGAYAVPGSGSGGHGHGAPVVRVPGDFSPLALATGGASAPDASPDHGHGRPADDEPAWTDLGRYPIPIMDNAVAELGGKVYSVGGVDGVTITAASYVYDPETAEWSSIADLPEGRENAAAAFIGGLLYVTGGWDPGVRPSTSTFVYDPAADTWSQVADGPVARAGAGRAVLDGKLYLVGGCTNTCGYSDVRRYDPATDTWQELADYPEFTAHLACGGIGGKLYCAGGTARGTDSASTYVYDPATDTWSPLASMPQVLWGMGYAVANDELVVSGGIGDGAITNAGFAYDPATDTWLDLPASGHLTYRGGSACGLDRIGGSTRSGFNPTSTSEMLPGYWACDGPESSWLNAGTTTATIAPGERLRVTLTLHAPRDASGEGEAAATLWVKEKTPYAVAPVAVTMRIPGRH